MTDKKTEAETQKLVASIVELLTRRGILDEDGSGQEALDEMVHEAASSMASDVNNSGAEAQVRFLLDQGYTLADFKAME